MNAIDERAVVHESARIGEDVTIGPFAIVGPNVTIGRGTTLAGMALVEKDTVIGEDCKLGHSAVIGTDPQDLKYHGETTHLVIGDRTTVREFATINRATGGEDDEPTRVGSDTPDNGLRPRGAQLLRSATRLSSRTPCNSPDT